MAINDPNYRYATRTFDADGVETQYEIGFDGGYIRQSDVVAFSVLVDPDTGLVTDRTNHPVVFLSEAIDPDTGWKVAQVEITPAVANGRSLVIYRSTQKEASMLDYSDGSIQTAKNLDLANAQSIMAIAEIQDGLNQAGIQLGGQVDLALDRIDEAIDEAEEATTRANDAAAAIEVIGTPTGASSVGFQQTGLFASIRNLLLKARERVSPEDFGAVGDGITDDSLALNRAFTAHKTVKLTQGKVYGVASTVTIGDRRQLDLNGATIRAIGSFVGSSVILVKEGDGTTPAWFTHIVGSGTVDGNFLANSCIEYYFARQCELDRVKTIRPLLYGVHAGSSANPTNGINIHKMEAWWHEEFDPVPGHTVNPAGSVGVFYDTCTDSYCTSSFAVGFRTGFVTGSSVELSHCHAWGRRAHGPLVACFRADASNATFTACYADTPHNWYWNGSAYAQDAAITEVYGFDIQAFSQYMVSCRTFINTDTAPAFGATDGVVVPVNMGPALASGGFGFIIGLTIAGGSASFRYKQHFGGVIDNATILGTSDGGASLFVDNTTRGYKIANSPVYTPVAWSTGGAWTNAATWTFNGAAVFNTPPQINGSAGTNRDVSWRTGGSERWVARTSNAAESGADTGSNWQLSSRTDAGAFKQLLINVQRDTGLISIGDAASTTTTNVRLNSRSQTTVGAAGGASALPATPTGYLILNVNGTDRKIPYYAV